MIWVLNYLGDLESDFSVFHRVDEFRDMDGPRFFRMANRLVAYDGVLRNRLMAEMQSESGSGRTETAPGARRKKVDLAAMHSSSPDLFEHVEV